jgi:hypothetical protein
MDKCCSTFVFRVHCTGENFHAIKLASAIYYIKIVMCYFKIYGDGPFKNFFRGVYQYFNNLTSMDYCIGGIKV